MARYFQEQLQKGNFQKRWMKRRINAIIKELKQQYPPSANYQIDSEGNRRIRYSIYTGAGGNSFFYYKLYLQFSSKYKHDLQQSLQTSLSLCAQDPQPGKISFFQGKIGIWAIAAVITKQSQWILLILQSESLIPQSQNQLLYGLAGYLYALLFILEQWKSPPYQEELISLINRVSYQLVRRGMTNGILKYSWPIGKKLYLGGAHGTIGILYILIQARKYLQENFDQVIISTINYLISLQFDSGNFPSSEGNRNDRLVQFCHGATGAVLLLCKAYEVYNQVHFLESALRAGEVVWKRGVLLKGKGLCHGISGNGYALLALYKTTKSRSWLQKAQTLAWAMQTNQELQQAIQNYQDNKIVQGVPDRPFSLMEGVEGQILFYCDLRNPLKAKFPGFDI